MYQLIIQLYVMQVHFRYICNVMFTSANGDRTNAPNYIVIFTDGKSDNRTLTWQQVSNPYIATIAYMLNAVENKVYMCSCTTRAGEIIILLTHGLDCNTVLI